MKIILDILFILVMLAGVLSLIISLPGNLIVLISAIIYGLFTNFEGLSLMFYITLVILVVAGEAIEFFSGVLGAKKFGASKAGMIGSLIGGIAGGLIGAAFLFGFGAIPGVFLGAFSGAVFAELLKGKNLKESVNAGIGAFLGRTFGMIFKVLIGLSMIFITVKTVYF